jgi:2-octaprenyl-6-methoxyphenol hydroxylase
LSRYADIAIIGGGLVGMAYAIALKQTLTDCEVVLFEGAPLGRTMPDPLDSRAAALNLSSKKLLHDLGVWPQLESVAAPIHRIHVSHQGHFGSTVLDASDVGGGPLGFVAENHLIGAAFMARARDLGVSVVFDQQVVRVESTSTGACVAFADGTSVSTGLAVIASGDPKLLDSLGISSPVRNSGQSAIVANVALAGAQAGTAFERFTANGPLAFLPLPSSGMSEQRFNVVWSMASQDVQRYQDMGDSDFLKALQRAFGWRLGRLNKLGQRSAFTLNRRVATEQHRAGILVAGNAAHTLHPVAGQGLNLSLSDVDACRIILGEVQKRRAALGSLETLGKVVASVADHQANIIDATDLLSTLFAPRGLVLDTPRNAALAALDLLPALRRRIARLGTGLR